MSTFGAGSFGGSASGEGETFGTLKAELLAHGHHYLSKEPGRVDRFVKRAAAELLSEHPWSWSRFEREIVPPAAIEDLRLIDQVVGQNGYPLSPSDRRTLRDRFQNLNAGGEPQYYWRELYQVGTYPVGSGPVMVSYFTRFPWRGAGGERLLYPNQDSDQPLCPPEYRDVITLLARTYAKSDVDGFDQVQMIRDQYEARLEEMRAEYGRDQVDEMRRIRVGNDDWA